MNAKRQSNESHRAVASREREIEPLLTIVFITILTNNRKFPRMIVVEKLSLSQERYCIRRYLVYCFSKFPIFFVKNRFLQDSV